jgi:hypothetical protein
MKMKQIVVALAWCVTVLVCVLVAVIIMAIGSSLWLAYDSAPARALPGMDSHARVIGDIAAFEGKLPEELLADQNQQPSPFFYSIVDSESGRFLLRTRIDRRRVVEAEYAITATGSVRQAVRVTR